MRSAIATFLYGAVALASPGASTNKFDVLNYVNPLIGTSNGGVSSRWKSISVQGHWLIGAKAMFSLAQHCRLVSRMGHNGRPAFNQ